jgi:hypothetical protein
MDQLPSLLAMGIFANESTTILKSKSSYNTSFQHYTNIVNMSFAFYPTSEFEDSCRANNPWIYMIVVFFVFLFTAGKSFIIMSYVGKMDSTNPSGICLVAGAFVGYIALLFSDFKGELC